MLEAWSWNSSSTLLGPVYFTLEGIWAGLIRELICGPAQMSAGTLPSVPAFQQADPPVPSSRWLSLPKRLKNPNAKPWADGGKLEPTGTSNRERSSCTGSVKTPKERTVHAVCVEKWSNFFSRIHKRFVHVCIK